MNPVHSVLRSLSGPVLLSLAACGIGPVIELSPEQLARFDAAGPIEPRLDEGRLLDAFSHAGPYRIVPGDVLRVDGPEAVMGLAPSQVTGGGSHRARVREDGTIQLPTGEPVKVVGLTVPEAEEAVADAFHPEILIRRPSILAEVEEYRLFKVAVVGAVGKPGVLELRADQLSLFGALAEFGGIQSGMQGGAGGAGGGLLAGSLGAAFIRIRRPGETREEAMALPVEGLTIPISDVELLGGETIEVIPWDTRIFTIMGLTRGTGVYPYPPTANFTLLEAISVAGGVDPIVAPPYATIFRADPSGEVLAATFEIFGAAASGPASRIQVKPGDIIFVAHTPASWTRDLLQRSIRLGIGFFFNPLNPGGD